MNLCIRLGVTVYYKPESNYAGRLAIKRKGEPEEILHKIYKDQGVKFGKNDLKYWLEIENIYTVEYLKLCDKYPALSNYEQEVFVELEILTNN